MSNQEFENYVALISKLLRLKREETELIAGELQDHLQLRVADLVADGKTREDAVKQALEEFGDAAVMAKNFQTVLNHKKRRWMMRLRLFQLREFFFAAVLAMALWPAGARFGSPSESVASGPAAQEKQAEPTDLMVVSESTQRDLKSEQVLKTVIDLQYEETPFSEVMEELSRETGLNFHLDESAEDDQLTRDEPITIFLKNIPVDKGLQLMLSKFNATYAIDDGVIVILSRDYLSSERLRLKMFDCRELVAKLPETNQQVYYPHHQPGGGGGGGGMFHLADPAYKQATESEYGEESAESDVENDGENLKQLVREMIQQNFENARELAQRDKPKPSSELTLEQIVIDMVDPDSWEMNGGTGRVKVVNGILIVSQNEVVLRKIDNLLQDLRGNVLSEPGAKVSFKVPVGRKLVRQPASPGDPKNSRKSEDPFGDDESAPGMRGIHLENS